MFEESLYVLKQEFRHSLSGVILERFLELVNQTSSNFFGNKHHVVKVSIKLFVYQICHFAL